MGIVCDSLIGLVKVPAVEFISAGTLTTLPSIDYYINGICREINLSSKSAKFKHCGFKWNPNFLALEQTVSFLLLTF